jgi:hypothetical protein
MCDTNGRASSLSPVALAKGDVARPPFVKRKNLRLQPKAFATSIPQPGRSRAISGIL